jgi:hypothetical protein
MPHYDRHADASAEQNQVHESTAGGVDTDAVEDAAEAIRDAEIQAVRPDPEIPDLLAIDAAQLESMSIDELRVVAKQLDVPDRSKITEQDDLIAAIKQRLVSARQK